MQVCKSKFTGMQVSNYQIIKLNKYATMGVKKYINKTWEDFGSDQSTITETRESTQEQN